MKKIRQGDIFWVDLPSPGDSKPPCRRTMVIVQNDVFNESRIAMRDVRDDTSHMIVVAEIDHDQDDPWKTTYPSECPTEPCNMGRAWAGQNCCTTFYGINANPTILNGGIQSHHPGGAGFAYADGHVDFLAEDIDRNTLWQLTTRSETFDDW